MDNKQLAGLRRHYEEAVAWGFPMDQILSESDVDFLFNHIDAQAERIRALEAENFDFDAPLIMPEPKYTVVGEVTPVGALAAAQERIKALEVAVTSDSAGYVKDCAAIRHETATAIAKFAVTYADETENDAGQNVKVIGLEQILRVCRAHGAVL